MHCGIWLPLWVGVCQWGSLEWQWCWVTASTFNMEPWLYPAFTEHAQMLRRHEIVESSVSMIDLRPCFIYLFCLDFLVRQHPCTIKQRPCSRMMGAWCRKTNNWSRRWHSASSWLSCLHTFGDGDAELGCRNAWWRSNERMSAYTLMAADLHVHVHGMRLY